MPSLTQNEQFYYDSFWALAASRGSNGFGLNPIPISEIKALADYYQLRNLDDRENLLTFVQALDTAYLNQLREKSDKEKSAKEAQEEAAKAAKAKGAKVGGTSTTRHRSPPRTGGVG